MRIAEKLNIVGGAFIVLGYGAAVYGWVWNIFKLIGLLDGGFTPWLIARCLGAVVPPLGVVLGYL